MPRWLIYFLVAFVVVNGIGLLASLPTPFLLFQPPPPGIEPRSMDGLAHGIGKMLAVGLIVVWAVVALVLWKVVRPKV